MTAKQKIIIFQQNGVGAAKAKGIQTYGQDLFTVETVEIDIPLPPVIDDTSEFLPESIDADLVLDFLAHPLHGSRGPLHPAGNPGGGFRQKIKRRAGGDAAHLMRAFEAGWSRQLQRLVRRT